MSWENIVQKVTPYIVKIETQNGHGTGFLCGYNENQSMCLVATALHVVNDCDEWQQPLKVRNLNSGKQAFLKETERVIFTDPQTDSAVTFFPSTYLDFPKSPIKLRPIEAPINIGTEVGWLGYPGIAADTLCFFSGSISARLEERSAYLIDGVAINGVSGGPVMYGSTTDGVEFVGIVSAYHANRQRGELLPGLLIAQDVSHFHRIIQMIKSVEEAKKKKSEIEAAQSQSQSSPSAPLPPSLTNPLTPSKELESND